MSLLVGEITAMLETAEVTLQAAQLGHLVCSQLCMRVIRSPH